jgi:hypothetical protein
LPGRLRYTVPAGVRMYRKRATAGPAAGPTETLHRDVRIEGSGTADSTVEFGDDQLAVPGMSVEIKQISDIAGEQLGSGNRLILLVRGAHDLSDRIVIGQPGRSDNQAAGWAGGPRKATE